CLYLIEVQARVVPLLDKMQVEKQLDMLVVMLTDILNESTYLIYSGAEAASIAASAYNLPQSRDGIMLKGVVSRKKQLIPELINVINER
ncbi:MAG: DHHA2 domain-containing protein, partial [Agathobacter rectalis]